MQIANNSLVILSRTIEGRHFSKNKEVVQIGTLRGSSHRPEAHFPQIQNIPSSIP